VNFTKNYTLLFYPISKIDPHRHVPREIQVPALSLNRTSRRRVGPRSFHVGSPCDSSESPHSKARFGRWHQTSHHVPRRRHPLTASKFTARRTHHTAPSILPSVALMRYLSFRDGRFPAWFKLAEVLPLLKKSGANQADPFNFRPISNLSTISKVLERLALGQLRPHLLSSP